MESNTNEFEKEKFIFGAFLVRGKVINIQIVTFSNTQQITFRFKLVVDFQAQWLVQKFSGSITQAWNIGGPMNLILMPNSLE